MIIMYDSVFYLHIQNNNILRETHLKADFTGFH